MTIYEQTMCTATTTTIIRASWHPTVANDNNGGSRPLVIFFLLLTNFTDIYLLFRLPVCLHHHCSTQRQQKGLETRNCLVISFYNFTNVCLLFRLDYQYCFHHDKDDSRRVKFSFLFINLLTFIFRLSVRLPPPPQHPALAKRARDTSQATGKSSFFSFL